MEPRLTFTVSSERTQVFFASGAATLAACCDLDNTFLLTDETIYAAHPLLFQGWRTIVIPSGEAHKQPETVQHVVDSLIRFEADRGSTLVGVGGGVITDMAGYVAGIYMRGIRHGFIPTTVLAMVDAALGGKNGVDVGLHKNLIGMIRQPAFLIMDTCLLETLPEPAWREGFAEIVKHAVLFDPNLFNELEQLGLDGYRHQPQALESLIQRNIDWKYKTVIADPTEQGPRKLLNFGHTLGHAFETLARIPHGHAVSQGMVAAATLAEELVGFPSTDKHRLLDLLQQLKLPVDWPAPKHEVLELIRMDKKRRGNAIHFVLPKRIGEAVIFPIPLPQLGDLIHQIF